MKKTIFYISLVLVLSGFFVSNRVALAADNNMDGHLWVFNFVVPANKSTLNVNFADWINASGVQPGSNIQIYSEESSNAPNQDNVININNATKYSGVLKLISGRNDGQVRVVVQAFQFVGGGNNAIKPTAEYVDTDGKTVTIGTSDAVTDLTPVIDTTAPVITLLGNSTVNLNVGDTYTDAGVTASDDVDGDITSKVVTVNPVDISTAGTYIITYDVSDVAGNKAVEVTRTVIVATSAPIVPPQSIIDTTAPVITLLGDSTVNLTVGDTYTDAGVTALDNVDGDITSKVVTVNPVDISTAGTYIITYDVTDVAGNKAVEVTRTVVVTASTPSEPTIDTTTPVVDLPSTSVNGSSTKDDVNSVQ